MVDPFKFKQEFWPDVKFSREQREVIYSVCSNKETYVPAANKMGKDYVAGFIILYFFLTRQPCRIVTTSAKDDHLRVLWGEIRTFITTSKIPLDSKDGGPLIINHREIKRLVVDEKTGQKRECDKSYIKGLVASPDTIASMQGHHIAETGDGIPRTLVVGDECSSLPHDYKKMFDSWAQRHLYIGNTWPCENFWKHAVKGKLGSDDKGGDIPRPPGPHGEPRGFYRRVIHIRAQDSPNVRLGLAEIAAGKHVSGRFLIPGIKGIEEYLENRERWDPIQQAVSLDAEFYEGSEVMLFPAEWLAGSIVQGELLGDRRNIARGASMGIDPGEGVANTSWSIVDEHGLIDQVSKKTNDTNVIPLETIALGVKYQVPASRWIFDLGGGGKQHMDRLRAMGYPCRGVAFGEPMTMEPKRGLVLLADKKEHREEKYVYVNRRAEMYGTIRMMIDPGNPLGRKGVFALPAAFSEVHRQLAPLPLLFDREGRMRLLPKNKRDANSDEPCMVDLLGCSPDEADSLALAVWGLLNQPTKQTAGVS